jgi:hypothetical protein
MRCHAVGATMIQTFDAFSTSINGAKYIVTPPDPRRCVVHLEIEHEGRRCRRPYVDLDDPAVRDGIAQSRGIDPLDLEDLAGRVRRMAGRRPVPAPAAPPFPDDCLARLAQLERDLADRDRTIQRLGDRLRVEQEEGARMVARITELEAELAVCEEVIRHPDQAASVGALDLVEAATRAYERGDVLTQDGKDYARVPFSQAARRRAAKTVSRAYRTIHEAGKLDAFTREEQIETATFKGQVPIAHIHIPPELRGRRAAAVRAILPEPAAKKHGGRRTIPVPREVANQPHPVRRKREAVTRWFDALSDKQLAVEVATVGIDFWTPKGESLAPEEVERQRVASGRQPAPVPSYLPTVQEPLRLHRHPGPRHLADRDISVTSRQDAEASPVTVPAEDAPGQCSDDDCTRPATIGGYCTSHYAEYTENSRRYAGVLDYAAGDD